MSSADTGASDVTILVQGGLISLSGTRYDTAKTTIDGGTFIVGRESRVLRDAAFVAEIFATDAIDANSTSADYLAEIRVEAAGALSDIFLDNLFAVAEADEAVNNSYWAKMISTTGDASLFVPATDSLQAIRDNTAWNTATGFSTHSQSDVWSVGTRELSAITASQLTAIENEIWDGLTSAHAVSGSMGTRLKRLPDAAPATAGGIPTVDTNNFVAGIQGTKNTLDALNDLSSGTVTTLIDTQLVLKKLDKLFTVAITDVDVADNSFAAQLVDDAATADYTNYDHTASSLSAIIARGNTSWITSTLTAGAMWEEAQSSHVSSGSFGAAIPEVLSLANIKTQTADALGVDTIPELPVGVPPATPTMKEAEMLLYMALRNRIIERGEADHLEIHNDAGVVIAKKLTTDVAGVYTEDKMVSG